MPGVVGVAGCGGCTIMPGCDTPIGACGPGVVAGCVVGTTAAPGVKPFGGGFWNWPG
jgi:hypothetical protein